MLFLHSTKSNHYYRWMFLEGIYPSMWKNYLVTPTIKVIKLCTFQTLDHLRLFRLHYKWKRNLWVYKLENADSNEASCAISLIMITDNIIEYYDSGQFIGLLLMDFHKAFHTIDSKILLSIL